jgi:hypothetical protein
MENKARQAHPKLIRLVLVVVSIPRSLELVSEAAKGAERASSFLLSPAGEATADVTRTSTFFIPSFLHLC